MLVDICFGTMLVALTVAVVLTVVVGFTCAIASFFIKEEK